MLNVHITTLIIFLFYEHVCHLHVANKSSVPVAQSTLFFNHESLQILRNIVVMRLAVLTATVFQH